MALLFPVAMHNTRKLAIPSPVYIPTPAGRQLLHFTAAERGNGRLTANILHRLPASLAKLRLETRGAPSREPTILCSPRSLARFPRSPEHSNSVHALVSLSLSLSLSRERYV